jgi:putative addiction module component (TIGR02574 family)
VKGRSRFLWVKGRSPYATDISCFCSKISLLFLHKLTVMTVEFAPIFELGLSEKLQLLEDLWDNIATQPANVPVLDCQKEELAKRKLSHSQNPSLASFWSSVKARIRSQRNG